MVSVSRIVSKGKTHRESLQPICIYLFQQSFRKPWLGLEKKTWPCPLNFVECYFLSHVWMAELECKERERQRTDAFELWCWRWLLRVPWTDCKEIQPVILKKISPEYSLEGLMLEVKLQYFGHLMRKNWLIGKDPDAGKDWRQEKGMTEDEIVGWHHWLNGPAFG